MFSVVIPAYNCQETIEMTLDSVRQQTRLDLIQEIIIINDGSSDGSEAVLKAYMSRYPTLPIQYHHQSNHGVSYTRNKAIKMAKADWIALLDSDDLWMPQKLERQYDVIQKTPAMFFLGSSFPLKILWRPRQGLCKLTARDLCWRNMPSTPSIVFKKDVGIELGLFNEGMKHCEDINFFQRFLLKDSYYVLAEDLVQIGIGKSYHGMSGLSSNLDGMHKGRHQNVKDLYEMGLISKPFMYLTFAMNSLKLIRRKTLRHLARLRQGG
ncbi:glycosyltransferase involved in cell wall biosynthesis [Streptococcus rupicaprae]|uniref:Glycosyltransferase involved in cell wall biosynthesis n=1 Tax=Streptococcus rupicaprae TaxID=759619 RepID=A0ABV2FG53_9STRE